MNIVVSRCLHLLFEPRSSTLHLIRAVTPHSSVITQIRCSQISSPFRVPAIHFQVGEGKRKHFQNAAFWCEDFLNPLFIHKRMVTVCRNRPIRMLDSMGPRPPQKSFTNFEECFQQSCSEVTITNEELMLNSWSVTLTT